MSKKYSDEFHKFMREIIPGHSTNEIKEALRKKGYNLTKSAIRSYKKNHNLMSGIKPGGVPGQSKIFPAKVVKYIYANYKGTGTCEMSEKLISEFGIEYKTSQIRNFYKNHGLKCGVDCRFKKGHEPANKGKKIKVHPNSKKTQFKKRNVPHNTVPVGTLIKKSDGYWWRKISEKKWKQEHILIWEKANGKVSEGTLVTFLDGNVNNLKLDNLEAISKKINGILNKKSRRSELSEVTRSGIAISKLESLLKEKNRRKNK